MFDYIRIACAVPAVRVGDVKKNTEDICAFLKEADQKQADVLVFPELAVTGYSCGDLFFQELLQASVKESLCRIVAASKECSNVTAVVGLPLPVDGELYNCAAVLAAGKVRGIYAKTFLPDYGSYGERRWFSPASYLRRKSIAAFELGLDGDYAIPVGNDILLTLGDGAKLAVEICEDLWAPVSPSAMLALGGAEVIVNPAAAVETAGKRAVRRDMVKQNAERNLCIYAFCGAGSTESTQDQVQSGHSVIAQCGTLLTEDANTNAGYMLVQDADLGAVRALRSKNTTFRDAGQLYGRPFPVRLTDEKCAALRSDGSLYPLSKLPFVPEKKAERDSWCKSVFDIQVEGLKQRLALLNTNGVIGVSGGLDSTLALMVAVEAMNRLGKSPSCIYGVTMPCFGTSDRTYRNSLALMEKLGISMKEIPIADAVTTHFRDIGHDAAKHDGTYENSQARERTQVLMDYASVVGGIVIGTGDLSELALGWCTYNGDHMSMYGVNGSVPKTLIRWIIRTMANTELFASVKDILLDILDTPISPELLPPDGQGKIAQQTEDLVGPYELHDFFLYHMLQNAYRPGKIYRMACQAFAGDYDAETVKKWLAVFYRRFFTQQFKRNCMPEGAKALDLSLSPRGDWRMPSDASAKLWLSQIEVL